MTENEAIEVGKSLYENITLKGNNIIPVAKYIEFVRMAIQALEENQELHAIGTVEEFKDLKEKADPKKSKEFHENEVCIDFICPNCKEIVYGQPYKPNYCKHCGQKLDWQ